MDLLRLHRLPTLPFSLPPSLPTTVLVDRIPKIPLSFLDSTAKQMGTAAAGFET